MKKLMTVIASVALAFGLYADGFKYNKTDFKNAPLGVLDLEKNDEGGNTAPFFWAGDVGESEIKAVSEADDAAKFLAIENSAPLYRTVNNAPDAKTQEIGTGVFADMYVKFTASDAADPIVLADGSKLGIWVAADEEAETPTTNLMVCAASLVNGWDAPVATNFTVALDADFDFKAEHRVTIRAIEEISESKYEMAGFVLYIDEELVAAADADYAAKVGFDAFNSVAAPFYNNKQLFVSLVEAGTLSAQTIYGVGFKGTGELTQIALTDADNAPEFAKPAVDVTFAWADGIESFTYQGIATNVGGKAGSVVVTLAGPTVPVTLSGVTASDGYVLGDIEAENLNEVEDGVWAFVEAPASLTMTAGEVAFTIGDKKYATFEDALAAAQPGDIIKLAKDCVWTGEVEIDVGEDNEITLDLAGKTISAEDYDDYDLFYITGGKLTIIDSVGGGKIAVTGAEDSSYTGIIYGNGGEAQIGLDSDDADKGVVVDALIGTEAGALTLIKGQFIKTLNEDPEDLENYLPEGDEYEVVDADDYWKVQKKGGPEPTFVIEIVGGKKYETIDAALEDAEDGDTLQLLDDVALDDTLVINKAVTLDLDNCEITLAADKAVGIDIKVDGVTITNGEIDSALTANVAYSKAINIPNKNVTLYDVEINAGHYEYAIYANCDDDCKAAGDQLTWFYDDDTRAKFATLNCELVNINGNGSLFHIEGMTANLKSCVAAYDNNPLFANEAHRAAVYSSVNALTTISGTGSYTHENALQSGNLGGKIFVKADSTAEFTGDIKSWMKVGAHPELEKTTGYAALFSLLGGIYDGEIVFVDDDARDLDFFIKAEAVTLAPPEGYQWNETTGVLEKIPPAPVTYTVTFNTNNFAYVTFDAVTNNTPFADLLAEFAEPKIDGYTFKGWTPVVEFITSNSTFEAILEKAGDYPSEDWPEADEAVKAKFSAWRAEKGQTADLSTDVAKKAFLLNCTVDEAEATELKITSITVDADGYATIEVNAPLGYGFNIDLSEINGVLYVEAGDKIETMQPRAITYWTTTSGKANVKVQYNFIKAAIGFKKPEVDADEKPPMTEE